MKPTLAIYGVHDRNYDGYPDFVHDHSVAYMHNGIVERFAELERITRFKHDNRMPKYLYTLLKDEKLISSNDYDIVFVDSVTGRAFISENGKMHFEAPLNNVLSNSLERGKCWWFDKEVDAWVLNHELAHIYSCVPFYGKFRENSLCVHFDGGASLSNFSAWHWKNNKMNLLRYNWDYKFLSTLFNANALNFYILNVKRTEHNSLPGKYMGFASYGTYKQEIEDWLTDNNYFENIWNNKTVFFESAYKRFKWKKNNFDTHDIFLQDIATTVQTIFVRNIIDILNNLKNETNAEYLYYTGGCALNIVANSKIVESGLFKDIFIPPCTSDTGLALGAASFVEIEKGNDIQLHSPYLNNWCLDKELNAYEIDDEQIKKIANILLQKKVIGICNGFGESGPRALGNRSIIALPDSKKLSEYISLECKKREWYRPIAPIMLENVAKSCTGLKEISPAAKYMLLDFNILPEYQNKLCGVVHVNNSSRIQVLSSREQNPFMWTLLSYLYENYGILALINTSFNTRGEPIVHSFADAQSAAKQLKLDALVFQGRLIG